MIFSSTTDGAERVGLCKAIASIGQAFGLLHCVCLCTESVKTVTGFECGTPAVGDAQGAGAGGALVDARVGRGAEHRRPADGARGARRSHQRVGCGVPRQRHRPGVRGAGWACSTVVILLVSAVLGVWMLGLRLGLAAVEETQKQE